MTKEFRLTIPKHKVIPIIDMLKEFEKLCDVRGIKFAEFTPEQVFEVIKLYKNWKTYPEDPPF